LHIELKCSSGLSPVRHQYQGFGAHTVWQSIQSELAPSRSYNTRTEATSPNKELNAEALKFEAEIRHKQLQTFMSIHVQCLSSVCQPSSQVPVELFPDSINAPYHTHSNFSLVNVRNFAPRSRGGRRTRRTRRVTHRFDLSLY
jgi:hypothetical protein